MPRKVKDIKLDEVSLVDKGANGGAFVVLMKAAKTKKEMGEDFPAAAFAYVPDAEKPSTWKLRLWDSVSEKETAAQVGRAVAAMGKGFRGNKASIPEEYQGKVKRKILSAWLKVNSDKGRKDAPQVLKIIKRYGKTFNEIMYTKEEMEVMWKAIMALEESLCSIMHDEELRDKKKAVAESTAQFQLKISTIKGEDMELEKLQKEYDALKVKHEELTKSHEKVVAQVEQLKKKEEPKKPEMPEDVKKQFDEIEKKAKEQAETIAKLLDEKESAVYLKKAEGFKNLPLKADEFAPVLKKAARALETTEMELLMKVLNGADEAIEKGNLFKEQGSNGSGEQTGEIMKRMEAKVGELMKEDGKLSKAQAFVKVMDVDPKLYEEYLENQG